MMLAKWFLKPSMVSRAEWQARPPRREVANLKPEISNLVVTYTETAQCTSKTECVRIVKDIQRKQMEEEDEPDISYNFLIGGDGNIYEGRGWKKVPKPFPRDMTGYETLQNNSIEIAFIGELGCKPSPKVMKAFASIIVKGMEDKAFTKDSSKFNPCIRMKNKIIFLRDLLKDKEFKEALTNNIEQKSKSMRA